MSTTTPRVRCLVMISSLVLGILPSYLPAVTLHVALNGDDANPGTAAKPFATLEKARQTVRTLNKTMQEDIVVLVHGGIYAISRSVTFEPADSGANRHDVVYRAAPNETPILSGGKRVVGWMPDQKGRWKATAPADDFRQLYVGGVRATRSRGTSPAGLKPVGDKGYETAAVDMANWKNPGDLEFCYLVVWTHSRCKVQDIQRVGDKAIITMLQPQFTQAKTKAGVTVANPNSMYIENALELLDEPGEWYLDRSAKTVYYMPRQGEDMTKVEVVAPVVEKLVELRGTLDKPVEHIRFEGISFQHGNWLRPSKVGHCDVQANFITDSEKNFYTLDGGFRNQHNESLKSPANVVCHAAKAVCFDHCTFSQLGSAGLDIEFGSQDNVVSGCSFYDISGTAIQIGDILKDDHHPDDPRKIVKDNSVLNCTIHDCCLDYMGGVGVFAGYIEGTRIVHNEICRLPYSGISVGWGWGMEDAGGGGYQQPHRYDTPTPAKNNRMEMNHIHHVMQALQDGAGIYTLGSMPGSIIRGNHIHDNAGVPGGIYLDEGSGFIEVANNLIHNVNKPMNYNNAAQNRKATCKEHDNFFGVEPEKAKSVIEKVGLEAGYRNLLEQKP